MGSGAIKKRAAEVSGLLVGAVDSFCRLVLLIFGMEFFFLSSFCFLKEGMTLLSFHDTTPNPPPGICKNAQCIDNDHPTRIL